MARYIPASGKCINRVAPDGGTEPLAVHEAINLQLGIKAMTLDSAYLMNMEDEVGSIEVGKFADMIVLDRNLFEIPDAEISECKVALTLVNGKAVFDASGSPIGEEAIEKQFDVQLDFTGQVGHPCCEWHRRPAPILQR